MTAPRVKSMTINVEEVLDIAGEHLRAIAIHLRRRIVRQEPKFPRAVWRHCEYIAAHVGTGLHEYTGAVAHSITELRGALEDLGYRFDDPYDGGVEDMLLSQMEKLLHRYTDTYFNGTIYDVGGIITTLTDCRHCLVVWGAWKGITLSRAVKHICPA